MKNLILKFNSLSVGIKIISIIIPIIAVSAIVTTIAFISEKEPVDSLSINELTVTETAEETTSVIPTYSEDDVKAFFELLVENYDGVYTSSQIFTLTNDNFTNISLDWLVKEKKYLINDGSLEYTGKCKHGDDELIISEIMSEDEFNEFLSVSDKNRRYSVFSMSDIENTVNSIWCEDNFDLRTLNKSDYKSKYVTSKGFLIAPETEFLSDETFQVGKYIDCKINGNEYIVSAYLLERIEQVVIDGSTGKKIGKTFNYSMEDAGDTFDDVISKAGIDISVLNKVEFVFVGTKNGVRFKEFKTSKILPENKVSGYITKTVIADGGLNLRLAPSTDSVIVTLIPDSSIVTILGESKTEKDWVYISVFDETDFVNYSGWVKSEFLF